MRYCDSLNRLRCGCPCTNVHNTQDCDYKKTLCVIVVLATESTWRAPSLASEVVVLSDTWVLLQQHSSLETAHCHSPLQEQTHHNIKTYFRKGIDGSNPKSAVLCLRQVCCEGATSLVATARAARCAFCFCEQESVKTMRSAELKMKSSTSFASALR